MTLGLGLTMGGDGTKEMPNPFGDEYRAKLELKNKNRDISSALLGVQVTVDGVNCTQFVGPKSWN